MHPPRSLKETLSFRELEILHYIAKGQPSKEIADKLHISKNTVDTHRRNMIKKAAVCNTTVLVAQAYKEGLL